ncbi:hypothetical protein K490DRAFT_55555 [Saccharata proteae CBS 121410]|uniref:F-box domain-containing protein n=1 Tax=Saccharata proteae CBS 121410 TaxID=1314787 RepID=A0A6A5YDL1_9PEZI|nr:hypothetical protein K490DRAFT_55555 [Saccharata proteae CBS 121410]
MGSWDCYCAICGSALCGVQIATHSRTRRFKRRQARKQQNRDNRERRARGEVVGVPSDVDSSDDEGSGEMEGKQPTMDPYEEDSSYDPDIVGVEDVEWTNRCWILGFNAEAKGVEKTFIAGPGHYDDYGSVRFEGSQAESDPNYPEDDFLSCTFSYGTFDEDRDPVFPFHWCCFELLLKSITGKMDPSAVDRNALYNTMRDVAPEYGGSLLLDYGEPTLSHEQFWESMPGQEYLVVHPTVIPNFGDIFRNLIINNDFKRVSAPDGFDALAEKVRRDDFAKLPYDILYKLAKLLPTSSIFALANASWSVNATLRQNEAFWKHLIRVRTPWFFELNDLLDDPAVMKGKDYRGLLLWLEKLTTPSLGMNGPFMGIANRHRIWGVCEQIRDRYWRKVAQQHQPWAVDGTAMSIMEHAENSLLPIVSFPPARENLASHSTQWLRTWDEVRDQVWKVETFWDNGARPLSYDGLECEDPRFLVGIALSTSRERRLFGQDNTNSRVTMMTADVPLKDFVSGFILHLPDMELHRIPIGRTVHEGIHPQSSLRTGIAAVTSGESRVLTHDGLEPKDEHLNQRALLVSPGRTLVGVMGSISTDGTIKRLGLLQCRRPPHDDFAYLREEGSDPLPFAQKRLWKSNMVEYLGTPIWSHPSLRFVVPISATDHDYSTAFSNDTVPHEALVWASPINGKDDLKIIKRISAYVTVGGQVTDGKETRDFHDVCGMRVEYTKESNCRKRFIGITRTAVPGSDDSRDEDWDEKNLVHLDIDGPGGEVVTSIAVAIHEVPKAIKIRTNRGQEVYWGEQKVGNWNELRAPDGETIIGMTMAFGKQSGWNWETQTHQARRGSSSLTRR